MKTFNRIVICLLSSIILLTCNREEIIITIDEAPVPTCEKCDFTCLEANESDVFTNECQDNWECKYELFSDSRVSIADENGVAAGNKNVFRLEVSTQGSEIIIDDESWHILVLELDENQNSFSVENEELGDMEAYLRRLCFCSLVDYMALDTGCIQGERQPDGTWFVQGNVTVTYEWGDFNFKFDAQF